MSTLAAGLCWLCPLVLSQGCGITRGFGITVPYPPYWDWGTALTLLLELCSPMSERPEGTLTCGLPCVSGLSVGGKLVSGA